jgi:hypothetical protein
VQGTHPPEHQSRRKPAATKPLSTPAIRLAAAATAPFVDCDGLIALVCDCASGRTEVAVKDPLGADLLPDAKADAEPDAEERETLPVAVGVVVEVNEVVAEVAVGTMTMVVSEVKDTDDDVEAAVTESDVDVDTDEVEDEDDVLAVVLDSLALEVVLDVHAAREGGGACPSPLMATLMVNFGLRLPLSPKTAEYGQLPSTGYGRAGH